jgi:hypothetical protein
LATATGGEAPLTLDLSEHFSTVDTPITRRVPDPLDRGPSGRVDGLLTLAPQLDFDFGDRLAGGTSPELVPRRGRAAVLPARPAPVEDALTEAVGLFVEEPRVPTVPYTAPPLLREMTLERDRMLGIEPQAHPAWVRSAPPSTPAEPPETLSPQAVSPQAVVLPEPPGVAEQVTVLPPLVPRRASLAESRRRGLSRLPAKVPEAPREPSQKRDAEVPADTDETGQAAGNGPGEPPPSTRAEFFDAPARGELVHVTDAEPGEADLAALPDVEPDPVGPQPVHRLPAVNGEEYPLEVAESPRSVEDALPAVAQPTSHPRVLDEVTPDLGGRGDIASAVLGSVDAEPAIPAPLVHREPTGEAMSSRTESPERIPALSDDLVTEVRAVLLRDSVSLSRDEEPLPVDNAVAAAPAVVYPESPLDHRDEESLAADDFATVAHLEPLPIRREEESEADSVTVVPDLARPEPTLVYREVRSPAADDPAAVTHIKTGPNHRGDESAIDLATVVPESVRQEPAPVHREEQTQAAGEFAPVSPLESVRIHRGDESANDGAPVELEPTRPEPPLIHRDGESRVSDVSVVESPPGVHDDESGAAEGFATVSRPEPPLIHLDEKSSAADGFDAEPTPVQGVEEPVDTSDVVTAVPVVVRPEHPLVLRDEESLSTAEPMTVVEPVVSVPVHRGQTADTSLGRPVPEVAQSVLPESGLATPPSVSPQRETEAQSTLAVLAHVAPPEPVGAEAEPVPIPSPESIDEPDTPLPEPRPAPLFLPADSLSAERDFPAPEILVHRASRSPERTADDGLPLTPSPVGEVLTGLDEDLRESTATDSAEPVRLRHAAPAVRLSETAVGMPENAGNTAAMTVVSRPDETVPLPPTEEEQEPIALPQTTPQVLADDLRRGSVVLPVVASRGSRVESVPGEVATRLAQLSTVDVSGVEVRRGPDVSAVARRLGARAFTAGGVVHVPDEAGPLDRTPASAALAHELTHLRQQWTLSGRVPSEESPEGKALEAEAIGVEQWFSGLGPQPTPMRHLRFAPAQAGGSAHHKGWATQDSVDSGPTQRAAESGSSTMESAADIAAQILAGRDGGGLAPVIETERAGVVHRDLPVTQLAEVVQATPPVPHLDPTSSSWQAVVDQLAAEPPRRWVDLDVSADLEELAAKLYERLHHRLRRDVLVQRERAGQLMDRR